MTAPMFVTATQVLEYLGLNAPGTTSQYSTETIGSNIKAASWTIEKVTQRWFADRPNVTWTTTTNGRAQLFIPGFRSVSSVTLQTAPLIADSSYWLLADAQGTGMFTGIQTRAFTSQSRDPAKPWLANPNWFDIAADSPWYPPNYGGAYAQSSLPNDLVITGNGGYADADLPEPVRFAAKVLSAFYTVRSQSILADVEVTVSGHLGQLPAEVSQFFRDWSIGEQAVTA